MTIIWPSRPEIAIAGNDGPDNRTRPCFRRRGGDGADFSPNKQQGEVYAALKKALEVRKDLFDKLIAAEVPAFNKMPAEKGLAGIIAAEVKQAGKTSSC